MDREEFIATLIGHGYHPMPKFESEPRNLYLDPTGQLPLIVVRPDNTAGFERLADGNRPTGNNRYNFADAMLLFMALLSERTH